jgi:hypothetical protein
MQYKKTGQTRQPQREDKINKKISVLKNKNRDQ